MTLARVRGVVGFVLYLASSRRHGRLGLESARALVGHCRVARCGCDGLDSCCNVMRTQSAISPLAVGLLLGLFAHSTNGAIVTYSDRSAWTAGAGGGTGTLVDNLDSGGFTRTGYTISGTGLGAHPNFNADTKRTVKWMARPVHTAIVQPGVPAFATRGNAVVSNAPQARSKMATAG